MHVLLSARTRRSLGADAVGIILSLVALAVAQAACGGARTPQAAVNLEPFQRLTRGADCARDRNSLFLIDDRYVLWAREDMACADNNYVSLFNQISDRLDVKVRDATKPTLALSRSQSR